VALTSKFSTVLPVFVVGSGGWLVRQVDANGVALDDGVTTYSVAKPVVTVTNLGATENSLYIYGVYRAVTLSPNGHPVVRVDENGTVVTTPLGTPLGGGSGGTPGLIFNVNTNNMYLPLISF
jgi:hypothetical protein